MKLIRSHNHSQLDAAVSDALDAFEAQQRASRHLARALLEVSGDWTQAAIGDDHLGSWDLRLEDPTGRARGMARAYQVTLDSDVIPDNQPDYAKSIALVRDECDPECSRLTATIRITRKDKQPATGLASGVLLLTLWQNANRKGKWLSFPLAIDEALDEGSAVAQLDAHLGPAFAARFDGFYDNRVYLLPRDCVSLRFFPAAPVRARLQGRKLEVGAWLQRAGRLDFAPVSETDATLRVTPCLQAIDRSADADEGLRFVIESRELDHDGQVWVEFVAGSEAEDETRRMDVEPDGRWHHVRKHAERDRAKIVRRGDASVLRIGVRCAADSTPSIGRTAACRFALERHLPRASATEAFVWCEIPLDANEAGQRLLIALEETRAGDAETRRAGMWMTVDPGDGWAVVRLYASLPRERDRAPDELAMYGITAVLDGNLPEPWRDAEQNLRQQLAKAVLLGPARKGLAGDSWACILAVLGKLPPATAPAQDDNFAAPCLPSERRNRELALAALLAVPTTRQALVVRARAISDTHPELVLAVLAQGVTDEATIRTDVATLVLRKQRIQQVLQALDPNNAAQPAPPPQSWFERRLRSLAVL